MSSGVAFLEEYAQHIHYDVYDACDQQDLKNPELGVVAQRLFGQTNTKAEEVVSFCFSTGVVDFPLVYILKQMHLAGFDINQLHLFVRDFQHNIDDIKEDYEIINVEFLELLLTFYNHRRVIKLLQSPFYHLRDIKTALKTLSEHTDFSPIKKPKNFEELHDEATDLAYKVDLGDSKLNQREDINALEGKLICDNLEIRVPQTHYDLVHLGEKLRFCIGNGDYTQSVQSGTSSIIALYRNNKPVYGVQFTRYSISQAHGFGNESEPSPDVYDSLRELLLAKPTLCGQFIPFEHSFMAGYRYDNENLYILFKSNNTVYQYKDVSHHVYDAFMASESKGSYFSRYIRNSFETTKIDELIE